MKIILAPNAFKGSLSPLEAARAMERGVRRADPNIETVLVPLADGGDGTVETLVAATGGEMRSARVSDPLGRPVQADFGILGDGETAVIEMAAASGLRLLSPSEYQPLETSTRGTGELVLAALDAGVRRIVLGIGGSATNDGGMGMLSALGIRFLDAKGRALRGRGKDLEETVEIDVSDLDPRLNATEILCACDVDNPLTGPTGAASVYGPQKGADPEMVSRLDTGLGHLYEIVERRLGKSVQNIPGSGAAGGLGAAIMAFSGGSLEPGADVVLRYSGFEAELEDADWVFTGEGKVDTSTLYGKVPSRVAEKALARSVPVICFGGNIAEEAAILHNKGVKALISILPGPMSSDEALLRAADFLEHAVEEVVRLIT